MKLASAMTLKYWDVVGRGEAIRVMLHVAKGIEWRDTLIGFSTWETEKTLAPMGCVPTLQVFEEEKQTGLPPLPPPFCQTTALARFTAKKAGYYPLNNDLDALVVDEALETMNELTDKIPWRGIDTEEEKKTQRQAFQAKEMTQVANLLESRIQTFGDGQRFVQSGWNVADVTLWALVHDVSSGQWDYVDTSFFNSYPGICATIKGIETHVVKEYRDSKAAVLQNKDEKTN